MTQPLSVTCHGMVWNLYSVEFVSPDGRFDFYIYAISDDHAQLQVDAIRETAKLNGRIEAVIDAGRES
jgi:hypothetical protein